MYTILILIFIFHFKLFLLPYFHTVDSGLLSYEAVILLFTNSYNPDKVERPNLSILIVNLATAQMQNSKN